MSGGADLRAGSEILCACPLHPTAVPSAGGRAGTEPSRRAFSPEYKLAMVAEYESAPNGEKGAILRREGLYSSHIIEWTRARDAGAREGVHRFRDDRAEHSKRSAEQPSWNGCAGRTRN